MTGRPVWRPPEAYVHGLGAPCVVVPGRVAAWLERYADLRRLRTAARGVDAEVDSVLVALGVVAAAWRSSATGTATARPPEPAAPSSMGTAQAADRLGLTGRGIRKAITGGRLPAVQVDGRWRIEAEAIEHFAATRAA